MVVDLLKTREVAYELAQEEAYKTACETRSFKDTNFSKRAPIYLTATSNVKGLLALYKNYKRVLTIGGTGALGLSAAINGAKKVDMFDINELQKVYYQLLETAITYLEYEEFIQYFSLEKLPKWFKKRDIDNLISTEMYEKLKGSLPSEARFVLDPLYESFYSSDLVLSELVNFKHTIDIDHLKRIVSFYNKAEYNKLQNILRNKECEINYHCVGLTDIPTYFKDEYDLVLLDNILQYYKNIPLLDTPEKVHQFISEKLVERVKDSGSIQVNYGFKVSTIAFLEKFGLSFDDMQTKNYNVFDPKITREMKEGINISLYENWKDNYQYDFISGVEEPIEKIKNMVITYKKR